MEYQIVDRNQDYERGCHSNLDITDSLLLNKAIQIIFPTQEQARIKGSSFGGSARRGRVDYSLHYRIIPEGGNFLLYIWKELKKK